MMINSFRPTTPKSAANWDNQARSIVELGYPAVANHLPDILYWLQDMNWPGSRTIADFLVSIGSPLIPHILEIMDGKDDEWKYWILIELVSKWDRDTIVPLESILVRLAQIPYSFSELDLISLKLLLKNKLGDLDTLKRAFKHKKEDAEYRVRELNEIERYWS